MSLVAARDRGAGVSRNLLPPIPDTNPRPSFDIEEVAEVNFSIGTEVSAQFIRLTVLPGRARLAVAVCEHPAVARDSAVPLLAAHS